MPPNILKSQAFLSLAQSILKGKRINANDLKDTSFEGNQPKLIDPRLLRMELYRTAIEMNPNSYIAVTNLAICISQGGPLEEDDLQYTRFKDTPLSYVNTNEAVADLYRYAININPKHTMAICNLIACFKKGAIPLPTDFIETNFEKEPLQSIQVLLYRKARRLNPKDPIANYVLATAIFNGAMFEEEDLKHTNLEEKSIEDITHFELAAEILRNFIEMNYENLHSIHNYDNLYSTYNNALYMLAACLLEDAPVSTRDLRHAGLNNDLVKNIHPFKIILLLYKEILSVDPHHAGVKAQLPELEDFFTQPLKRQRDYAPLYNSQNSRLKIQNTQVIPTSSNLETFSKKSPK